MKIEVRCAGCGRGYLLDETAASERPACPGCGRPLAGRPRQTPLPAPAPAEAATPTRTSQPAEEVVCPRCQLHFTPSRLAAAVAEARRRTVLLVEDAGFLRQVAVAALASRFEVKTAGSLRDAEALLAAGGVDALVLDLTLEGDGGRQLLARLRPKPCPIVIYTAQDESEIYGAAWEQLQRLGADDVVIKGMHVGELLVRKVAALLGESVEEDQPIR